MHVLVCVSEYLFPCYICVHFIKNYTLDLLEIPMYITWGKKQFLSIAHVLAIIFLSLFSTHPLCWFVVVVFFNYFEGRCQMRAIVPCCDPQVGGVAEV